NVEEEPVSLRRLVNGTPAVRYEEDGLHAAAGGDGGDVAELVGLLGGKGDERVGPVGAERTDGEFEKPRLVATHAEPREVFALDQELDAERLGQTRRRFERGRQVDEAHPWLVPADHGRTPRARGSGNRIMPPSGA